MNPVTVTLDPEVQLHGWEPHTFAKDQPPYQPLSGVINALDPRVPFATFWEPSEEELRFLRQELFAGRPIRVQITTLTFGEKLQPVSVDVDMTTAPVPRSLVLTDQP